MTDHQILRQVLQKHGVEHNTMVWFSTDNGPHTLADPASLNPEAAARSGGQLAATNGLRQCKASVFEGGIRVPGFIAWPQALGSAHKRTAHVSSSLDFMATVNEILGLEYPQPTWTVDSKSLLPLIDGRESLDAPRGKPIGWQYGDQRAVTNQTSDGTWKMVASPAIGQCEIMLPPYTDRQPGPFLFELDSDPTESHDLCPTNPSKCDAMKQLMADYFASVANSAANESQCA
jgi:arylsulfatase A